MECGVVKEQRKRKGVERGDQGEGKLGVGYEVGLGVVVSCLKDE